MRWGMHTRPIRVDLAPQGIELFGTDEGEKLAAFLHDQFFYMEIVPRNATKEDFAKWKVDTPVIEPIDEFELAMYANAQDKPIVIFGSDNMVRVVRTIVGGFYNYIGWAYERE